VTANEVGPGAKLDQFTIVKAIGHGAYSDVYLAEDPAGRQVVLKCPHESIMGDVATFDRFRRELEIARHLHHPGIQRPIEFTENRSRPYMVMEYVEGETLRAMLSREKRLSVDKVVDLGQQLAAQWRTPTNRVSCIATSSRRTCSSRRTEGSSSRISASR